MIKNELIKFFTPLKLSFYIISLIITMLFPIVIFGDKVIKSISAYNFMYDNVHDILKFIIPMFLAIITSDIFTQDYESGCLKFFLIYKKKVTVFFYKLISLIIISSILVLVSFFILGFMYICKYPNNLNILLNESLLILKLIGTFIVTLIPILLIYVCISIVFSNSIIISIITFIFVIMSDLFVKYLIDVTPSRFFRTFLTKGRAIDSFSFILFVAYILIFTILDLKLFSKKEVLH